MQEDGVIVFLKYPEEGAVKTRIGREMGHAFARELYRFFVADLFDKLTLCRADTLVYFTPRERRRLVRSWLNPGLKLFSQSDGNLGERMNAAFQEQFKAGYRRLILIGSDIPHIPSSYLETALSYLQNLGAVIGPSTDGGYYLIGFHSRYYIQQIFDGIHWSTSSVFQETMRVFEQNNLMPEMLPEMSDIDTSADLKKALREEGPFAMPQTVNYIRTLKGRIYGY